MAMKKEMLEKIETKYLDFDKIIRSQDSKILQNLPQFLLNIMKRIVCQNQLNYLLNIFEDRHNVDFASACVFDYLKMDCSVSFQQDLPKNQRYIFACNHPLGAVDFFAAAWAVEHFFSNLRVIANELITAIPHVRELLLPVNIFGKSNEKNQSAIKNALASDNQVMTFPAGLVSRRRKGVIKDPNWHRSFIRNAIEFKRQVIPVFIDARNSNLFYFVARLREKLGIKTNIELFLLPSEQFKQQDKSIGVHFGKPIDFKLFDSSKTHLEWAQYVKKQLYAIAQNKGPERKMSPQMVRKTK